MTEIQIPFNAWSREKLKTHKTCTSRTKKYGTTGDVFCVDGIKYQLLDIQYLDTEYIIRFLFYDEGASSPDELRTVLLKIFRGHLPKNLYVHYFEKKEAKK